MEEQEIKTKIIEILSELEKIEDKKENQEKIFEIVYKLRRLYNDYEDDEDKYKFREIYTKDKDLKNEKYPNAFLILIKYLIDDETHSCLEHNNKLKEQKDKEQKDKELEKND